MNNLICEMFIESQEHILPIRVKLFNVMLDKSIFPQAWSIIVPIPKKGDLSDPNNYHGICLSIYRHNIKATAIMGGNQ